MQLQYPILSIRTQHVRASARAHAHGEKSVWRPYSAAMILEYGAIVSCDTLRASALTPTHLLTPKPVTHIHSPTATPSAHTRSHAHTPSTLRHKSGGHWKQQAVPRVLLVFPLFCFLFKKNPDCIRLDYVCLHLVEHTLRVCMRACAESRRRLMHATDGTLAQKHG